MGGGKRLPLLFEVSVPARGIHFDDFRSLVRRNAAVNSDIRYYVNENVNKDQVAIYDRKLPRRNPDILQHTGYSAEDHWRDSHVCEMALFNGEVPMEGVNPKSDLRENKLLGKHYRGALAALHLLITAGSLDWRSDELRRLLQQHGRRMPQPPF